MFKSFAGKLQALSLMGLAMLVGVGASSNAMAAVDTTSTLAEITSASTAAQAIAAAVLVLIVGIAVYRWVRRAL